MADLKADIAKQLGEAQSKYTYFLLAAAASCIALAVKRTTDSQMEWSQIPLGLAVLSWGASFWAGCKNRAYFSSTLYANVGLLQIEDGTHANQPDHPALVQAAREGIMSAAERNSSSANKWGHWQFRLLVAGALLFLVWHVTTMVDLPTNSKAEQGVAPQSATRSESKPEGGDKPQPESKERSR